LNYLTSCPVPPGELSISPREIRLVQLTEKGRTSESSGANVIAKRHNSIPLGLAKRNFDKLTTRDFILSYVLDKKLLSELSGNGVTLESVTRVSISITNSPHTHEVFVGFSRESLPALNHG
jgi:hypothetical protein